MADTLIVIANSLYILLLVENIIILKHVKISNNTDEQALFVSGMAVFLVGAFVPSLAKFFIIILDSSNDAGVLIIFSIVFPLSLALLIFNCFVDKQFNTINHVKKLIK